MTSFALIVHSHLQLAHAVRQEIPDTRAPVPFLEGYCAALDDLQTVMVATPVWNLDHAPDLLLERVAAVRDPLVARLEAQGVPIRLHDSDPPDAEPVPVRPALPVPTLPPAEAEELPQPVAAQARAHGASG